MQIAILLYEGFTALDAIGPYESLSHIPGTSTVFVAERPGPVGNDNGHLRVRVEAALDDVPRPDVLLVPGSGRYAEQQTNPAVLDWLRSADRTSAWTASVCTGSLILAAAGLLTGRRATTHWYGLAELGDLGALPTDARYVFDGKYVTAAGVSAGIDMGLALSGRIAGATHAQTVQLLMQYEPRPPYAAGDPATAPAGIVAAARRTLAAVIG
ncbi:DJ-1/PfpI family protein [Streptomyces pactum]|uniref:DJ-1/PfpI family protein n=1 Tax=Streptomyces pactum TaxID=68249 RepID=A0ABS0NL09_9ACTN|nr:DJ-1/PfpI family protein [Streptomyces pactum]MBH5335877.1 DJ-1/PfpI family protein [Streptomyces pactum]